MEIKCWFCGRPVLADDRAHRSLDGGLAVHAHCLRDDARSESGPEPPHRPLEAG